MRSAGLAAGCCFLLLAGCHASREKDSVKVVLPPEIVQRQSCQALLGAGDKGEEELVLTGLAQHGHPDVLRIRCEDGERTVLFALLPASDDLGMKKLRKAWQSKARSDCGDYRSCPKFDVSGTFVGSLRPDPADGSRRLFFVRTADHVRRHRIPESKNEERPKPRRTVNGRRQPPLAAN